jgi:choline kinase
MEQVESSKYLAIIISEVKSSSRELYPLTKNYPMALLSVGSKKLIVYQLEALLGASELESNSFMRQKS